MCGILTVQCKRGTSAVKPLLKRYHKQEYRGRSGYGYIAINQEGYVSEVVRKTDEEGITEALQNENSATIMMHHRAPTSLPNYEGATHPFFVTDPRFRHDYYFMHNGVIHNHVFLWAEYAKQGFKFQSEMATGKYHEFVNSGEFYDTREDKTQINDSEVLAIDLAMFIEGQQTVIKSAGTIAFMGLQLVKEGPEKGKVISIVYGNNGGNPLEIEEDKVLLSISSEAGGKEVPAGSIFFRDWETGAVSSEVAEGLKYYGYNANSKGKDSPTKGERRNARKEQDRKARDWSRSERERNNANMEDEGPSIDYGAPDYAEDGLDVIDEAVAKMTGGRLIESRPVIAVVDRIANDEAAREARSIANGSMNKVWPLLTAKQRDSANSQDYEDMELSLIDIGIDMSQIENEIAAAELGKSEADAGVLRNLRDDIEDTLAAENDALRELRGAQELLRAEASKGAYFKLEDGEAAKAMVDAASDKYTNAHKARNATQAELESHIEQYGGRY